MNSSNSPTEIGGEQRAFRSTLWTVVLTAKDPGAPERREALETLIRTYWKPIYFFIRRRESNSESAKDITQGFFSTLLERNFLKNVDRGRGKFRTYLLAALENYMTDEHKRAAAEKRGGGKPLLSLDFIGAESEATKIAASQDTPDQLFRREWAIRVMSQALHKVREDFASKGHLPEFETLRLHLNPTTSEPATYLSIAKAMGIGEQDVANRIHRARARYREAILEVIRSYTESEEDAQSEVRDLFSAFS